MSVSTATVRECSLRSSCVPRKPKKREAVCSLRARGIYTQRQPRLRERRLRTPSDRVHTVASLQEFFKDSVEAAKAKQGVAADDHEAFGHRMLFPQRGRDSNPGTVPVRFA